jgi:Arc/MetJ-type ribon-helix-helix transcriptional regulator
MSLTRERIPIGAELAFVLRPCRTWLTLSAMKTLTVRLPDSIAVEIENESRTRGVSKSDVVRERLSPRHSTAETRGTMIELIGDILEKSWAAEVSAEAPRFNSPKKQKLAALIRAKKLHHR